jgi:signal transduction histidine kinase
MSLKPVKYLSFDDEKGLLYSAGIQSLLIPVGFIVSLKEILKKLVNISAAQILVYKIGQSIGEGHARTLEEILKKEKIKISKETLLKESYNAISMHAGWGKIEILKCDLKKKDIVVKIVNPLSGQLLKEDQYNLEKGILTGAYQKIAGEEIYFQSLKEKKGQFVILQSLEKVPEEFLTREKMALIGRKEMEEKVKERTQESEDARRALMNMLEDVDEAKKTADEEKNKTLAIITNLTDGLLVFSQEIFNKNNKLALINPQAEDILKISGKELLGKSLEEMRSSPQIKLMIDLIQKDPGKLIRRELKIEENIILEISVLPLINRGEKIGSLIILHDISREKEIENMKSEFVSTAAHQLRTPLSAIKWTLQMIIDGDLGYLSPEQKTFLMQGYKSNERMINLVNDLLNVARIEEGRFGYQFSLIHLEDLIQATIQDFIHKIQEKKINFQYLRPSNPLPKVNVDPAKMRLVIGNLIDNAIKYTPKNKQVTISIKYDKLNLEVSIKDSGIGIPADQQKRLFSKFFRSENAVRAQTEGSGLGLFIVKNIIEKHKGAIWFESAENKGSNFCFTLPVNKS